jgi:lysophospholipase L1-like esterase
LRSINMSPAAKLLVPLLVFGVILGGWTLYRHHRDATVALPDAGRGGGCALWFVGSSSIHRWTSLQSDMAPWTSYNRGIDGATLSDIVPRFANIDAREGRPRALIIYVGENDIAQGVPVRDVTRRLAALFALRDRLLTDVPVLLLSMKPSPGRQANFPEQQRFNAAVQAFLPHMRMAHYADVTTPLLAGGTLGDNYQADGVHMNVGGYRIWADVVRSRLADILPRAVMQACAPRR